jgi:hypothetical protein
MLSSMTVLSQTILDQNTVVKTVDFDYLEGCETGKGGCEPIEIIRKRSKDSVLLIFPYGGTQSDVYLCSVNCETVVGHDRKFAGQGKPTLNLTNLKDGEYFARIVSCGLGGSCIVRLKTKAE